MWVTLVALFLWVTLVALFFLSCLPFHPKNKVLKEKKNKERSMICTYIPHVVIGFPNTTVNTGSGAQQGGGGAVGERPLKHFILWLRTCLNRWATHFKVGLGPCNISSFLLQIYLRPSSQNYLLAPLITNSLNGVHNVRWNDTFRCNSCHRGYTYK